MTLLRSLLAACLVALALSASAQSLGDDLGTLTIGTEADPSSLDPLRVGSYVERQFAIAIFDTLLEVDVNGEIVPNLATSFDVSADGKTYVLHLQHGVQFHDGTPFNADAVAFNLNRARDPKNSCRCLANVSAIESVRAIDETAVEIHLKVPYASFPAILADAPAMMASPTAVRADPIAFGNHPVGTGPFKLESWTKGSRFIAVRNEAYWRGKPRLERVIFRGLQNSETREATMRSGALDVLTQPPPKFTLWAKRQPDYRVIEPAGFGSTFVALNTRHPDLRDVRVRRAIAHATNRPLFLKALFYDLLPIATTPFGPGLPGLKQVEDYPQFDPAKARALLRDYGKPVSITLMADNTPTSLLAIQALQYMWQTVGIDVELKVVDQARNVQNMLAHSFDTALFRWSGRPDPDLNVFGFFHSMNADRRVSSNYVRYANPRMDQLLNAGRQTQARAARIDIYNQISELLAVDLPYIFVGYVNAPIIHRPNVHGIAPVPDALVRVADVWKE